MEDNDNHGGGDGVNNGNSNRNNNSGSDSNGECSHPHRDEPVAAAEEDIDCNLFPSDSDNVDDSTSASVDMVQTSNVLDSPETGEVARQRCNREQ